MSTKLYVGNLSWDTRADDLYSLFGKYGAVVSFAAWVLGVISCSLDISEGAVLGPAALSCLSLVVEWPLLQLVRACFCFLSLCVSRRQ